MPSIISWTSLAVGLFAVASPALASDVNGFSGNLMARTLGKRRPNHADEFGYPHNRAHVHDGSRMTPGGYRDPKPSNPGAACTRDNQCHTHISLAEAFCINNKCGFGCLGDTVYDGTTCVGAFYEDSCTASSDCTTSVKNATPLCLSDLCTFACDSGYYASGAKCLKSKAQCGDEVCPTVVNGSTVCSSDGESCVAQCPTYAGYMLYTNSANSVYKCIDVTSDPDNCRKVGNACVAGYNGKGTPTCEHSECGLDCGDLSKVTPSSGSPYCA